MPLRKHLLARTLPPAEPGSGAVPAGSWNGKPAGAEWIDRPATYHGLGCGLAFADGHAEIHHWLDSRTPVKNGDVNRSTQPNNPDIRWMMERTSAKR